MGTDNYTKEERGFYESIMQEIRSHQDFGKRNPVDIGIECGYSEDDVMGMIYMCQDIAGDKQTQQDPIPVSENWELEGIIPFEDFVKIKFPDSIDSDNPTIDFKWKECCDQLSINPMAIEFTLNYAEDVKRIPLSKIICKRPGYATHKMLDGFEYMMKWMSLYGMVASKMFENNKAPIPLTRNEIESIESLIKLEIEAGVFTPIDKMVIEANGWDINNVTNIKVQANEQTE